MRVRKKHARSHRQGLNINRLVAGGIFATVAVWTLTVTEDPNAVPVVLAAVALAYGVKPPEASP